MYLLDVNVILAMHRADHPHHEVASAWFGKTLSSGVDFGVPPGVWASFLRVSTNRRIFTVPTPRAEAFEFIDAVIAQRAYLPIDPGPRHHTLLRGLVHEADVAGDLMAHAVVAAIALERAAVIVSFDRDFARFSSVEWLHPGDGQAP